MADDDDNGIHYPPSYTHYALSGKIMFGAIVLLLFVVILMICLHLYVRLYLISSFRRAPRRRSRSRARRAHFVFTVESAGTRPTAGAAPSRGLPESVLKSLPVFVHSPKTDTDQMYCAVCLSEFEENEIGRIIPNCKHSFHVGCIDMWFYSHGNCPLCRSEVVADTGSDNPDKIAIFISDSERNEPGSSSGSCSGGEEPSSVELVVVASSDEATPDEGLRQVDDTSGHGTSRAATTNFVKSSSLKRILCRDKRDGVRPSGNAVTDTAERDLEKEERETACPLS